METALNTPIETMKCATCKHLGDEPIESRDWQHYEEGQRFVTFYECQRVHHDENWKYPPGEQAVVVDGSGYRAALCVEDTFGCVLWEPKDASVIDGVKA
jgi:hypothetical protein